MDYGRIWTSIGEGFRSIGEGFASMFSVAPIDRSAIVRKYSRAHWDASIKDSVAADIEAAAQDWERVSGDWRAAAEDNDPGLRKRFGRVSQDCDAVAATLRDLASDVREGRVEFEVKVEKTKVRK